MTILPRLKQETLPLHQQLEQRVDVLQRLQSVAAYRELLRAFYGFYAPLEQALETFDWPAVGLEWAERRKVERLETDLQRLGVDLSTIPRCTQLPAVTDAASALGCLYVLEGATLGGQFIQKELASRLQITAENGAAFFNSYGERVGPMWAEFRQVLVSFSTNTEREDQIVRAAKDTFEKFDAWLAIAFRP
jgi:heme oxygenase